MLIITVAVWTPMKSLSILKPGRLLSALAIETPIRWPIGQILLPASRADHRPQTAFLRGRPGAEFRRQAGERVWHTRARGLIFNAWCILVLWDICDFTHGILSASRWQEPPGACYEGQYSFFDDQARIKLGIRQGFSGMQPA